MEPVAIVTAILAALYIVCRGPLVVAPAATVDCYRRMLSTPGRIRVFGGLLALLAAALLITARQARVVHGDITFVPEAFGWAAGVAGVWVIAAPGPWHRLFNSFWDAIPTPALRRAIGVFNIGLGLILGWVAFFALYRCVSCGGTQTVPRSCCNRHCPACQHERVGAWLAEQTERLLPCHYFLITFTVPQEVRAAMLAQRRKSGLPAWLPLVFGSLDRPLPPLQAQLQSNANTTAVPPRRSAANSHAQNH